MRTTPLLRALALALTLTSTALHAQVPQILNYQGRVAGGKFTCPFATLDHLRIVHHAFIGVLDCRLQEGGN